MDHDTAQPRPSPGEHRVGQPLDDLSMTEIDARILMLQAEIARLEAARAAKRTALDKADAFFRTDAGHD